MSTIDQIRSVLRDIDPVLAVLAVAQRITGIGGPPAAEGIAMLTAAIKAWEDGSTGVMTPAEAAAAIDAILASEVQLDATEDAKLVARFPAVPLASAAKP
jgi:hypothetical protein